MCWKGILVITNSLKKQKSKSVTSFSFWSFELNLPSTALKYVRVICGVSMWDNKRNTELRANSGLERVEVMLTRRRLEWLGHVAKISNNHIPKRMLVYRPEGGKCVCY